MEEDLRSAAALRAVRRVLAPHLAAAAALWLPPAAKEGQGDCEFPLGPPWILLLPLETPPLRGGVGGGGALRSYAALCRFCMWWMMLCVLAVPCGFCGAFLRRFWLRQQPRGCLRRPMRARGIALYPQAHRGFSY